MRWRRHSAPTATFDSSAGRAYLMPIMTTRRFAPRPFAGDHLVIASHNKGKIPEIAALLAGRLRIYGESSLAVGSSARR